MPRARAISQELTPFLQLQIIQNPHIHLSRPRGESSKIVPTLSVNCFLQPLQNHMRRVLINECSSDPQRGARNYTIWPAKIERVLKAAVRITEVNNCGLKCLRRFHDSNVRRFALCVKYIISLVRPVKRARPITAPCRHLQTRSY